MFGKFVDMRALALAMLMLFISQILGSTCFAADNPVDRQWVTEEVTQSKDGSFADPHLDSEGNLYYSGYQVFGELTSKGGIYRNSKLIPRYEGVRYARMSVDDGHLCLLTTASGAGGQGEEWVILIDGEEVGTSAENISLPMFDRNKVDYVWTFKNGQGLFGLETVWSSGRRASLCDMVLPEDSTCGYSYGPWPGPIGFNRGVFYADIYHNTDKRHVLINTSSGEQIRSGRIAKVEKFSMDGDYILQFGADASGAKMMNRLNVCTGQMKRVPMPEGSSGPLELRINDQGSVFFRETKENGDTWIYIGDGWSSWTEPLIITGCYTSDWRGNQVVWQRLGPGDSDSQIFRATYKRVQ